ncbi:GAF domain-containing protein [Haloferax larsenii]|uniref:GAF domain-containing protein n=1 Tax=Haloferax larsenii TaxID=302484 RepID=A0A1H7PEZ7_HALLR|nr:GAF domain-containing protein [Haloferax larsenii]ELZ80378.1 response regulator receiver modulated GAF sensor protein [Haloferax larsenii JCM 13917]UVE52335.1 GAF domain-containing protein [Haloferax larsenii]SEL34360.1 GAF domain-containing protein [Haloferax larsenii]
MSRKILCVDTDDRVGAVADALDSEETMTTVQATTVEEARTALDEQAIVCVVTEYELADGSGLDVVRAIRETAPQTPCILFTDVPPNEVETDSFEEVIIEYVNRDLPDAHDRLAFIADDVINHSAQVGFLKPDDEQERLDALSRYDVDELPVQESFERLTDLIASHFDAAISFIGLLEEDEENFLACHGGDWDSLTRENTICTHSMLQEDVMVVEDIREDKRFSQNQQLENLGIVSYAGANMTTPDGHVIGQVCLIDHEVRSYSDAQRHELEQFAETAMEILQLRQSLLESRSLEVAQ